MVYIFDFDGTLVDSMDAWAGLHAKQLSDAGIPVPENYAQIITPIGNYKAAELNISLGIPETLESYLARVNKILLDAYAYEIPLKAHVQETLQTLYRNGHRLQVLTAASHPFLDPCLQRVGIWDLFENVWSIDDFGLTKDNPAIYQMAAQRLGVPITECIFADDNITAILAAKSAGMRTIGIYDKSSASRKEEMLQSAERYIHDFSQI